MYTIKGLKKELEVKKQECEKHSGAGYDNLLKERDQNLAQIKTLDNRLSDLQKDYDEYLQKIKALRQFDDEVRENHKKEIARLKKEITGLRPPSTTPKEGFFPIPIWEFLDTFSRKHHH